MAQIVIEVKQVPDNEPNATGVWVRYTIEDTDLRRAEKRRDIWTGDGFLAKLVPANSHPVSYRRVT